MNGAGWTNLETAKLVVSLLTPLAVLGIGFLLNSRLRRVEAVQWANQIVVGRRVELFDKVAPQLNRLLCFAAFVGRWKETTPSEAIALKRDLDEVMFSNRVLFSPELFAAYEAFMASLFDLYARTDGDALLRVALSGPLGDRRKLGWWRDGMESSFSLNPSSIAEVYASHDALSDRFRADLYVIHTTAPLLDSAKTTNRSDV